MKKEKEDVTVEELDDLDNQELEDIVLDNYEHKDRFKKWMFLSGSIALIFIIVISIVKIVSDSSSAPQDALIENEEIALEEKSSIEDNLEEIPILEANEEDDKEEFHKVISEVMKKEQMLAQSDIAKSLLAQETPPPKPVEKRVVERKVYHPPKVTHPSPKPTPPKPKPKPSSPKNIYIQVGAFLKQGPDERFLDKIKELGFNYRVKEFEINDKKVKRVYIGPFASRKEASNYLPKIRSHINPHAFITRIR
ncbi:MAG: SPOR domain-containing protein [Epsilonproteobacteria bacterium]|nr:SPOR domain-containing protein [Campylobacterota bacterium]